MDQDIQDTQDLQDTNDILCPVSPVSPGPVLKRSVHDIEGLIGPIIVS